MSEGAFVILTVKPLNGHQNVVAWERIDFGGWENIEHPLVFCVYGPILQKTNGSQARIKGESKHKLFLICPKRDLEQIFLFFLYIIRKQ